MPVPPAGCATYTCHTLGGLKRRLALAAAGIAGCIVLAAALFARSAPHQSWPKVANVAIVTASWVLASWSQRPVADAAQLSSAASACLRAFACTLLALSVVVMAEYAFGRLDQVAKPTLLAWAAGQFLLVAALHLGASAHLRARLTRNACLHRALVISESLGAAQALGDAIRRESRCHIGICAAAALPGLAGAPPLEWVEHTVTSSRIDRVIIGSFAGGVPHLGPLLDRLALVAVDVTVIPTLAGRPAAVRKVDRIGVLAALDVSVRPLTPSQAGWKRAEDVAVASALLLLLLPLLVLIAAAIRAESEGPVLFGQLREGFHGQVFKLWKFRTMRQALADPGAVRQTSRGDHRVTGVGRLLRRLSLDELPQLINVLRGEMSIVGPRPHALGMTAGGMPMAEILHTYTARHRLKPGITGWAQIRGCRGQIDSHEKLRQRVSLDCEYIDRWSLVLDAWIILRTATSMLFDSDAY